MSAGGVFWKPVPGLAAMATAGLVLALQLHAGSANGGRASGPDEAEAARRGRDVFLYACVNCHGAEGRGASRSVVGFDLPLPDFTDPDFTKREPDNDWEAIIHMGGPVRGFSELMPAFGEVLTEEEIRQAVSYLRSFSVDNAWPRGELNFPRALVTEKAFPEDELIFAASAGDGFDTLAGQVFYEQRFGARNQYEILVPFGWSRVAAEGPESGTDWVSSLGDAAVAVKRAFYHSLRRGSILSAGAELIVPTGNEAAGFGKGTFVFEPFILFGQAFPAEAFFQGQAGVELPFQRAKAASEAYLRLVFGKSFVSGRWGRVWSPMVELLTAREIVSGGETSWDVVPQVQVTLNKRRSVMFNIGARIPLNETSARKVELMAYVLWDWFDGGFLEGW